MFKLALLQMQVAGGEPVQNVSHALALIAEAAAHAHVILLPEAFTLGWTHPAALTQAEPIPTGATCQALMAAAMQHGVYICAGLVEQAGAHIYNAAILINAQGEIILHHRKLNELDIGQEFYALGDRLGVAHTPLGTFGLMICADGFAKDQVISRTLGLMGADVILSPSSWAVPAEHNNLQNPYGALWLDNYGPVARDFRMWIAGVSNVGWITAGPWQGQQCIGCSLVVGPNGEAAVHGPYGVQAETILYATIQPVPRPAQGTGWPVLWKS